MSKQKVAVVVDSTAYLPDNLVKKYNIHVIPQILNWAGESLYDNVDITPTQFYERLTHARVMPTTSQPSVGEFHDFFQKVAETADSIVATLISEPLSGTQASAREAAKMMPNVPIEIVDSRSSSMGLGFMTLAAARAAADGADYKEAAAAARALVDKMNLLFVVDTLEYLHRGGRIGGAQKLIGSMLSIKPILHLEDGRIQPLGRVRTKKKAIQFILDLVAEKTAGHDDVRIAVLDAASSKSSELIYNEVKRRINPTELVQVELSPVLGAHVGPGTVGIAYYVP